MVMRDISRLHDCLLGHVDELLLPDYDVMPNEAAASESVQV